MAELVPAGVFPFDGRGPELRRAVWDSDGTTLLAIDYTEYTEPRGRLRHVRFSRPQVVMFTPEEVIGEIPSLAGGVAALDLGRSEWFRTFNPQHLDRCSHFQLLFYDELLDIICESLEFADGPFTSTA